MIKTKTVLILGAGASIPYSFPSGFELLRDIQRGISDSGIGMFKRLVKIVPDPSKIKSFYKDLRDADPLSIDAFLEYRQEYLELGNLAIAFSLIPKEDIGKLFNQSRQKVHWYQFLFEKLSRDLPSPESFANNKLSIITFNYDRSLEYYLFTVLKTKYNFSDESCAEILDNIPIIHVHGSLGPLPWQKGRIAQGKHARPYGPNKSDRGGNLITDKEIIDASKQIIVIPQSTETTEEFHYAFDQLFVAERIYFLGFGYHELNLKRLRMKDIKEVSLLKGTCYGMAQTDINAIKSKYKISFAPRKIDTLDFLSDHAPLE